MEVNQQKGDTPKIKDKIEVVQGIVNIFRDLSIFSALLLLVIVPKFMHQKLSDAGFVKGEIAGFTWEKQLGKTDGKLIEAANQIDSLKRRLEDTTQIIVNKGSEVDDQNSGIERQLQKNKLTIQQANSLNSGIQSTLKDNTPLLNPKVNTETAALVQIVNGYKIQIFYNNDNPSQKKAALEIKSALEEIGIKSIIQVLARPSSIDKASSNQIRYYAANEREVAFALQKILAESYSSMSFKLQTVYTPSPGSISIFLKS